MKIFPPYLIVVEPVLQTKLQEARRIGFLSPGTFQAHSNLQIDSQRTFMPIPSWYSGQGVGQGFSPNLMQHTDQKWGKASMNEKYRSIFESFRRLTRCECESTYHQ